MFVAGMATARRTQAERTAQTRAKLLDATIECLAEVGYAATTGREVAARAGVSRGAQTHHFPRRLDLIVGAVEEIGQRRLQQWTQALATLPPGRKRLRRALDLLWEQFTSPLSIASTKLWIAADDDPELYERMIAMETGIAKSFRSHARKLLRDLARADGFDRNLSVALSAIRGLALVRAFEPIEQKRPDPWPYHRDALERLLTDPTSSERALRRKR
jgi:AcrR family transcriptional regulator